MFFGTIKRNIQKFFLLIFHNGNHKLTRLEIEKAGEKNNKTTSASPSYPRRVGNFIKNDKLI